MTTSIYFVQEKYIFNTCAIVRLESNNSRYTTDFRIIYKIYGLF